MDDNMGTPEERKAVKAACDALKVLNKKLDECALIGIKTRLEAQGFGYLAEFTKTTTIFPWQG
jgi:hypothetical protein